MRNSGMSSMKARLRSQIVTVQERMKRTARLIRRRNCTNLAILYGPGDIGEQWCNFINHMFTEDLPEEYRDMNLDFVEESITNLGEDDVCNINNCEYKMLLLDAEALKVLKDEQSTFRKCELMETQQEQVIVLLLGSEDDLTFIHNARATLALLKENEAYNIIQAKNSEQIFTEIMTILSPLYVVPHPNILSSEDREQHLTLLSNKPFPTHHFVQYIIEFSLGKNTKEMEASLFNPYTLLVQNITHPPGLVTVKIFCVVHNPHTPNDITDVSRTQMGEDLHVWFQSDSDKVYSILDSQANPIAFLCQAMHVSERRDPGRTPEGMIDKLLTESFKKNVPDNKLSIVFGNDQQLGEDQDGNREEYVPTLLHFSAMYGLRDLTTNLLRCPGAVQAYGTANCDGDYPTNLAEKSGHWDLRDFMQTYMEVAAMVHDNYGNKGNMQTSEIMSSMVYGQYLSFAGDVGIPEDIYVAIGDGFMSNVNTPPGYVPMQPAAVSHDLPQSVDYDYTLRRILEGDEPEKEYEMLDSPLQIPPIPGERRKSTFMCAPVNEEPPLPPPREPKLPPRESIDPQTAMLTLPKFSSNMSPAQEELISLQKKVKLGELTINQAVFRFKEWERKHKETAASFQYQQENLHRLRISLMKSRDERKQRGDSGSIKISEPLVAGSSTYDKVLLKTRREVMVDAYGGIGEKTPNRSSIERRGDITRQNEYSHGPSRNSFGNSFKKHPSFVRGRPPPSTPDNMSDRLSRLSLSSTGSSIKSTGSEGSNPPLGSILASIHARANSPLPPRPTKNNSMSEFGRPLTTSQVMPSHPEPWNPYSHGSSGAAYSHGSSGAAYSHGSSGPMYSHGAEAPPPVPPRDDQEFHRPNVPPRNPRYK
ncbi:uncharacterized protein LOC120347653 isoform X2 [Styela clava]